KEYAATKEKLGAEFENLKKSHDGEIAQLKKEYEDRLKQMQEEHAGEVDELKKEAANLTRERDDAITSSSGLSEEKTTLEKEIEGLQVAVGASLDEGF
ncbi:hypothetical protein A2U01_0074399, partial [Trifolium medium]|nr:hypothetical protein [Trifolium medium]